MAEILVFEPNAENRKLLEKAISALHKARFVTQTSQLFSLLNEKIYSAIVADISSMQKRYSAELISQIKEVAATADLFILLKMENFNKMVSHFAGRAFVVPFNTSGLKDLVVLLRYHVGRTSKSAKRVARKEELRFIGKSKSILLILEQIELVKDADIHILITGETGSGKTELARYIHNGSQRYNAPFVHINCAAIPDNLLESELFGYKKGAFTGAYVDKIGIFGSAGRGTVFLDEIGELPSYLQAKLLKVVDEKDYYPVGGTTPLKVNARIITATNSDLVKAVNEKRFREDLYYRLNMVQFHIPPLRDRKEDIPELFSYFIRKRVETDKAKQPEIEPSVFELLQTYSWPGNVRELQNLVERISFRKPDKITPALLPDSFFTTPRAKIIRAAADYWSLERVKREYAQYIYKITHENKSKAARILNVDIKTVRKLLRSDTGKN